MIQSPLYKSLLLLRECAKECGHQELVIALGWSCIRIAGDEVAQRLVDIVKRNKDGCGND